MARRNAQQPATATATAAPATVTPPPDRAKATATGERRRTGLRAQARGGNWKPLYLAALEANGGNYTAAARAAGCGRTTIYDERDRHPEFQRDEAAAIKRGMRTLEAEAVRRAVAGVKRIKFQPKTGTIHFEKEYSDVLLLRLLEQRETGSWRQKQQVEHSGGMTFKTRAERKAALAAMQERLGVAVAPATVSGNS